MTKDSIPFLVAVSPQEHEDAKGIFSRNDDDSVIVKDIPVSKLKESITNLSTAFLSTLSDIQEVGKFKLKSVELQVEVTAEGGIEFIGTSKLGAKGAITLTFSE